MDNTEILSRSKLADKAYRYSYISMTALGIHTDLSRLVDYLGDTLHPEELIKLAETLDCMVKIHLRHQYSNLKKDIDNG